MVPILISGCNGGDTCCTSSNQCDVGEGDCDSDNGCKGNLVCGKNNCAGSTFDSTDDCCTDPGESLFYLLGATFISNQKNNINSV